MAKTPNATAKRGTSVSAKSVGIKSAKTLTLAMVMSAIKKSASDNASHRSKQNYTDEGSKSLALAIVKAYGKKSLADVGITTERDDAKSRRDFAKKIKAPTISPDEVLHKNTSDRPENAIRSRLATVSETVFQMYGIKIAPYAVRVTPYKKDKQSDVFIVMQK
jgi:hypothetical protein